MHGDHSSKCFRDGHYHMVLRERKIFVISWHTRVSILLGLPVSELSSISVNIGK